MQGTHAIYILDSSCFLSGIQPPAGILYTVPGVVDEVRPGRKELGFARALGLEVRTPAPGSIRQVEEAAGSTGDIHRLSNTDIHLIALALETGGTLLTDDYSMQNTARSLGTPYRPVAGTGISKVERWYHRCAYCGAYQEGPSRECPICGGPMKTTRRPPARKPCGPLHDAKLHSGGHESSPSLPEDG